VPSPTGVPLIATHKAKYIQTADGLSLGPGPFVTALENASGVTARVVGKPTKDFFQMVINDFTDDEMRSRDGSNTAETGNLISRQSRKGHGKIVVIGDDVEADLGGGALELDLWRVLGEMILNFCHYSRHFEYSVHPAMRIHSLFRDMMRRFGFADHDFFLNPVC